MVGLLTVQFEQDTSSLYSPWNGNHALPEMRGQPCSHLGGHCQAATYSRSYFLLAAWLKAPETMADDAIWEAEAIVTVPISTVLCLSLLPQGGIPLGELLRVSDHL